MELAVVLLVIAVIFVAKAVKVVPQQSAWVVERLGKYHGVLTPGRSDPATYPIWWLSRMGLTGSLQEDAAAARFIRKSITSEPSVPRSTSRRCSSAMDGGRMKTETRSFSACSRSCCVPCQSMSNSTSRPWTSFASTYLRGVP